MADIRIMTRPQGRGEWAILSPAMLPKVRQAVYDLLVRENGTPTPIAEVRFKFVEEATGEHNYVYFRREEDTAQ